MAETKSRTSRRVKFTAAFIQQAIRGEHPGAWTDTESPLRLKPTATGAQYFVTKKVDGKPIKVTPKDSTGRVIADTAGLWTLKEARAWAKGVVVDLTRGIAPAPEPTAPTAQVTFAKVAAAYLESYAKTHALTSVRAESYGVRYANEVLGDISPRDIGAKEATALKDRFGDSPANSRKAWGAAQRVMDHAIAGELAEVNIFRALKGPRPPRAKTRYPALRDVPAIELACMETQGVGSEIIRFLLRFPLRTEAAAGLSWGEVDLEAGELHLNPGEGRKFRDTQRLPLPALAVELLAARRPENPKPRDLVFPSDRGTGQFSGWSRLYRRIRERSGVGGWSPHDFRRLCVSATAEFRTDISEEALDRLLTHSQSSTQGGIRGVYQRSAGFAGMRAAADAWDELLRGALAGNVVQHRRVAQ